MPEPTLFVFDAYGTLFDVHSAVGRHRARLGAEGDHFSRLWRTKQLEYSWVRTLAGAPFRDFEALTALALDHALARYSLHDPALRSDLLEAYETLDAFPEVPSVLTSLRARGRRLAVLSNGTRAQLGAALASSGLGEHFDAVISVDEVRRFKTSPQVYALVGERFGVAAGEISFQSANRWDIAGAHLAGFRTVWVNRSAEPEEYPDCPSDRVIASLADL